MNALSDCLAVAVGGGAGAVLRYGITWLFTWSPAERWTQWASLPLGGGSALGTTIANLAGCACLGLLIQTTEMFAAADSTPLSPRWILAIRVGGLGSLTTFSTLIGEAAMLGQTGRWGVGVALLSVNLILGMTVFYAAMSLAKGWATP